MQIVLIPFILKHCIYVKVFWILMSYEGVSKSFQTGRLEQEMWMVQLSATRCSCIAILNQSSEFCHHTSVLLLNECFLLCLFCYWLSLETFGYTLVYCHSRIPVFQRSMLPASSGLFQSYLHYLKSKFIFPYLLNIHCIE